ncbi:alpha/beta hydrolase, partial [Methylobacterium sp. WL18]
MTRLLIALASLLGLGLAAYAFTAASPLTLFDAIGPRDAGGRL